MTEKITVLQGEGLTTMMVFKPCDDRFTQMNLTDGFGGGVICTWTILKRDTPAMISAYLSDGYKIISELKYKTDEEEKK